MIAAAAFALAILIEVIPSLVFRQGELNAGFPRNEFWNIRYVDNDHEGIPRNSLRI